MLIEPACNYLFNYFAWRKNIEDIDDQGLTVLLTLLQSQFQMNLTFLIMQRLFIQQFMKLINI